MDKPHLVLYGTPLSGHAHRVEALLHQLRLGYEYRVAPADYRRSTEFRAITPLGQIPVLVDSGRVIPDSNAILIHLARCYDPEGLWLPKEHAREVEVHRWLAIAAGDIRFGPALARLIVRFGFPADLKTAEAVAIPLFKFMETHLIKQEWLVGERPTIADLACYPYLATASEGGLPLDPYPRLRAWLSRVEAIPGFRPMPRQVA